MKDKLTLGVLFLFLGVGLALGLFINADRDGLFPPDLQSAPHQTSMKTGGGREISSGTFAKIARDVTPAVVTITSEKKVSLGGNLDDLFKKFHKDMPEQGLGSGIIVRKEGYILTNNHVVSDADKIRVKLQDKRVLDATYLGADPLTDIALIKIDANELPTVKFGNSDNLEVGEWVLAIGSPLSLNSTVTAGIVSALGRQIDIIGDSYGVEHFIQTDAVINPGNSGGALVNMDGELIGINTAIATKTGLYQGYGFAVPVNIARHVVDDLLTYGQVVRGYIGVAIREVDATYARAVGLKKAQGVIVESLTDNGAAKEAGLAEGDVILEIDGHELNQPGDLQAYVALKQPGDRVKLSVFRDGQQTEKHVVLRSKDGTTTLPKVIRPSDEKKGSEQQIGYGLGFEVDNIAEENRSNANYNYGRGVVVTNSSYQAKEKNVFEGFIITRVNRKDVSNLEDYVREVRGLKDGDAVVIHLVSSSGDRSRIVTAVEVRKKN